VRIVELFAGLCGWTSAADLELDVVVTTDLDPRFETTVTADVLDRDLGARLLDALGGRPDVVLASPPCEAFSVLQIGRNWTGPTDVPPHAPKTERAELALRIVERTRELLDELAPAYYVIENPRAKLRKLPVVADLERRTVTYCQLGEPFMKPTDLWGGFPPSLVLPATCDTRKGDIVDVDGLPFVTDAAGEPCHVSAPRGSKTGIQGDGVVTSRITSRPTRGGLSAQKDVTRRAYGTTDDQQMLAALRAKVPLELSRLVLDAARVDLDAGRESTIAGQGSLW
jgi:hypothetical protein